MDFNQIAQDFPGRKDVIHTVVEHSPSVTDIRAMKIGRFTPFLVHTGRRLLGQFIQVNTAGMATSVNVFDKDLRFRKITLIPSGSA
jgi:hypothetical protein